MQLLELFKNRLFGQKLSLVSLSVSCRRHRKKPLWWLDSLVGRALQKDAVAHHEARVFSRGGFRELVEDIWTYLVGNKDDIVWGGSKEDAGRIRNISRSQEHKKEIGDYTERDERTRQTLKRESSPSSSEASIRSSRSRPKTKLSRREEDGSDQQQKHNWEYSSAEMNNNEGVKGYLTFN